MLQRLARPTVADEYGGKRESHRRRILRIPTIDRAADELGVNEKTHLRWAGGEASDADLDRIVGLILRSHVEVLDWLKGETSVDPLP